MGSITKDHSTQGYSTQDIKPTAKKSLSIRNCIDWLKSNLFNGPVDTIITLGLCLFLGAVIPSLLDWLILNASLFGTTSSDCNTNGACWIFIKEFLPQFIFGFYPEEARWRIYLAVFLVIIFIMLTVLFRRKHLPKNTVTTYLPWSLFLSYPVIAFFLLYGGIFGLPVIETYQWGGLFLTIIIAVIGIVGAFPLGILLALGRQSSLPVIRAFCRIFIELWRGIPLITVLFMASVMLPLFLPHNLDIDKLVRALLCIMLFASAYLAEVIRGGLQSLPQGQQEAAKALGLSYWHQMRYVILPQALQHVIPGIVNTFIGLFKDTTLVLIIGLFDFLGIIQAAATNPQWLGHAIEGYLFAAAVFWCFCFSMSRYSIHLERKRLQQH